MYIYIHVYIKKMHITGPAIGPSVPSPGDARFRTETRAPMPAAVGFAVSPFAAHGYLAWHSTLHPMLMTAVVRRMVVTSVILRRRPRTQRKPSTSEGQGRQRRCSWGWPDEGAGDSGDDSYYNSSHFAGCWSVSPLHPCPLRQIHPAVVSH